MDHTDGGDGPVTVTPRCQAAHREDTSPCDGPGDAVRVVNASDTSVTGCVHHGSMLLATLVGGRVYPDAVPGAAIEAYRRAQSRK